MSGYEFLGCVIILAIIILGLVTSNSKIEPPSGPFDGFQ